MSLNFFVLEFSGKLQHLTLLKIKMKMNFSEKRQRPHLVVILVRLCVVPECEGADCVQVHLQTPLAVDAPASAVDAQWLAQQSSSSVTHAAAKKKTEMTTSSRNLGLWTYLRAALASEQPVPPAEELMVDR